MIMLTQSISHTKKMYRVHFYYLLRVRIVNPSDFIIIIGLRIVNPSDAIIISGQAPSFAHRSAHQFRSIRFYCVFCEWLASGDHMLSGFCAARAYSSRR